MRFKMMALAAAVSFTLPVAAQTADSASPKPAKEKKLCRRMDETGAILSSRMVCHTKSEWAQIDASHGARVDETLGRTRPIGGERP